MARDVCVAGGSWQVMCAAGNVCGRGCVCGSGCMVGDVCGAGGCQSELMFVWQRMCMAGDECVARRGFVRGREMCITGDVCGMGCAWQDTCIAGEHVWWRGGYEWQGVMLGRGNAWQGSV